MCIQSLPLFNALLLQSDPTPSQRSQSQVESVLREDIDLDGDDEVSVYMFKYMCI